MCALIIMAGSHKNPIHLHKQAHYVEHAPVPASNLIMISSAFYKKGLLGGCALNVELSDDAPASSLPSFCGNQFESKGMETKLLPYRNPYIKGPKREKSIDFLDFFGGPGPGALGPFGRMGNVHWVILGFRPQKCTQIFLGP